MPIRYFAAAVLLTAMPLLHAQNAADRGVKNIIVTATRTPRPASATLAPSTVITRADIERTQVRSVRELLTRTPGISVANQGGPGKLASIFLRGTASDQVLVLVDGVRYGDATSGLTAIQNLPVGAIQRIEIVRGPRSSLYGADAIGGVIQVFTRDGQGTRGDKPYFSVGAGRYDSYDGQVGVSGASEHAHYNISVSGTDSDGFDSCSGRPFGAPGGGAGCFADQPDDDGYSRLAGSLRAGYRFDSGLKLNVHALRTDGDNRFDGSVTNQADSRQQVFGVSAAGRPFDPWRVKLSLGRSEDRSDGYLDGRFVNTFETERNSVKLQNDISLNADNQVIFGLDYRRETVASNLVYTDTARANTGVFAQYLGNWGRHGLQLALRGDDNEQFGEHATGSATYGLHITDVYTVSASYGTAFKAPTFNELYYPSTPGFPPASNPDLDPEESASYEIGLDSRRHWGHWSLHAYQTHIDDLIALDSVFTPQNISEARIRGVEADLGAAFGAWLLNANASYLDTENRADASNRNNKLPRRPDYTVQLDADRRFGRYSAGASVHYGGSRYDDAANTDKLDDYVLVGIRGAVEVTDDWRVQARISNLLDEDYRTVDFYNQPGRTLFVTLRYQP